ncbi:MAG: sigma-70 family RNA polymerase sigma factor [Candidatus Limnocylindrales bacterium]
MAIEVGATSDDEIRAVILARLPDGLRLASWILHDPVAAEDAVQEAALLAWDRRSSLRDPTSGEAWFNRILVNVCRGELRRRARRPLVRDIAPTADGSYGVADRDELTRAIRSLAPEEQLLLALRFGRDLTVPAIAAASGTREGTVKSRLHSALEHLRAVIEAGRRLEESAG